MSSASPAPEPVIPPRLVLYDGVCGLCNTYVQWLLDHDSEGRLSYAALQGETAAALRALHPEIPKDLDTIVFVDAGVVRLRSQAVLDVARELPGPYWLLSGFRVVPRPVRDVVYKFIAKRRIQWFGEVDSCRLPRENEAQRFFA